MFGIKYYMNEFDEMEHQSLFAVREGARANLATRLRSMKDSFSV